MGDSGEERLNCPRVVWDGRELDWVEPKSGRLYLRGVGLDYLVNQAFEDGYRKLLREYKPLKRYRLGLFIPCSYGKPYSQSYIHYLIRAAIAPWIKSGLVHEIILTNAGVVPRELDEYWPYTAYDWNPLKETPEIRRCYRLVLKHRIKGYIEKFRGYYDSFAAYLRWDSDSWAALREAAGELGLSIPNLAPTSVPGNEISRAGLGLGYDEDPDIVLITESALKKLRGELERLLGYPSL